MVGGLAPVRRTSDRGGLKERIVCECGRRLPEIVHRDDLKRGATSIDDRKARALSDSLDHFWQ